MFAAVFSRTQNSDRLPGPRPKAHSEQSRHRPDLDQHEEATAPVGGVPRQATFWGWLQGQRALQGGKEFTGNPRRQRMADGSKEERAPHVKAFTGGLPHLPPAGPMRTRPGSG